MRVRIDFELTDEEFVDPMEVVTAIANAYYAGQTIDGTCAAEHFRVLAQIEEFKVYLLPEPVVRG